MPDFSFAAGNRPTAAQWNAWVRDQVETVCTSSTRPASPVAGRRIYESDTNRTYRWSGGAWVQIDGPFPAIADPAFATGWSGSIKIKRISTDAVMVVVAAVRGSGGTNYITTGLPGNIFVTGSCISVLHRNSSGVMYADPNAVVHDYGSLFVYGASSTAGDLFNCQFVINCTSP